MNKDKYTLSKLEQETHFSQTAVDRMNNTVHITTDDPVWIHKLEKAGFVGEEISDFGTMNFVCENCTMGVRKKTKRDLTDKQRSVLAERMRNVGNKES